ncbi:hypothetical protein H632_c629p0 [Helicosporidium sp. ATCC 50920]|nr:hypothetical protein H632_c629p0 [Helicosporidium sp. ATCC 50920]|eukprot:KDD75539.1 hypothetical protein H632_c629p0 [Helicosporidium sp. ATCC 50920]
MTIDSVAGKCILFTPLVVPASLGPLAIKAAVLWSVELLEVEGLTALWTDASASPDSTLLDSAWRVLWSVMALDLLHDAWFYWAHRLMHLRPFYRRMHSLHHSSVAPTPLAGYSFSLGEGALVFLNEIAVAFFLPIPADLHRAYHLWATLVHCGGHAGYEIAPLIPTLPGALAGAAAWVGAALAGCCGGLGFLEALASWLQTWPKDRLNTVRHHDMHHRHPAYHFSLYFTHWDRLCGTEHPDYRAKTRALSAKRRRAVSNSAVQAALVN